MTILKFGPIVLFVEGGISCHELPKLPRITEITKRLAELTTKYTEITGTYCRYMFTWFQNVTFITVSNMLMIHVREKYEETGICYIYNNFKYITSKQTPLIF